MQSHKSLKEELTDILQFISVILLVSGMFYAVTHFQHSDDYYTSEGTQ